jgi:hypothetical protein
MIMLMVFSLLLLFIYDSLSLPFRVCFEMNQKKSYSLDFPVVSSGLWPPVPIQKGEGSLSLSNPNYLLKKIIISKRILTKENYLLMEIKNNWQYAETKS